MTFKDCYRLTLHTINNNRYRSILTVIISTFLSFLIMGLMSLVISFSINANNVVGTAYFSENSIVSVNYFNPRVEGENRQQVFTENHYEPFLNMIEKHKKVIDQIIYRINGRGPCTFTDPDYPVFVGINIIQGRNIQKSEARNEAIISKDAFDPEKYQIGGTYTAIENFTVRIPNGVMVNQSDEVEFKLVGVYEYSGETSIVRNGVQGNLGYNDIIGDVGILFNLKNNDYCVATMSIEHYNEVMNKSPVKLINDMKSLTDDLNALLPQYVVRGVFGGWVTTYDYVDSLTCTVYDVYAKSNLQRFLIILSGTVFSIILLLISVGSLANSVMISIDTSKKFIGLLKALGMKGHSLKLVVILESLTLIAAGVLLGYCLLFAFQSPLTNLIGVIINSSYSEYVLMTGFISTMYLPLYVFAGTIFLFVVFTIVFSRGSLNKIAKMEPIAVINEVS